MIVGFSVDESHYISSSFRDTGDFISSVLSTGPENILKLWDALQNDDPEFFLELDGAGCNGEEGFFTYQFMEVMESKKLADVRGLHSLEAIFDGNNERMHEVLNEIAGNEVEDVGCRASV
jgi:hypothetical protein